VIFHPVADKFEDARRNAFFDEGHAAGLSDLVTEPSAKPGTDRCEQDEQEPALMLRGHHDDHDVGDAGQRQWNEGAVDDRDQEDTKEPEAEEQMQERAARVVSSSRLLRSCLEVSSDDHGSCAQTHKD